MTLKSYTLRGAVASTLLLAASASYAWDARVEAADHVVYWAGATASSLSAQELAVGAVCDSDPANTDDTTLFYVPGNGNDWALACRGVAGGKTGLVGKILIKKRDRDGSGVGVGPLQSNVPISFVTVSNATCATVGGGPTIPAPEGGNVATFGCTATYTDSHVAELGTSDIEPDKFFDINTPVIDGGTPFPYVNGVAFGAQASLAALVFNTPVTLNVRNALQRVQFASTSHCHPDNVDYGATSTVSITGRAAPTWGETEECMPSLTRSEIDSILTGRIVQWTQLLQSNGTAIPGLTGPVQICRRVNGSGTQATINALVSSFPCDANRADNSLDIVKPRDPNGTTVIGNSGSGDVDNCLHNFAASANPNAIGVLSVEGRNTGNNRNWRYIKIDGAAPTLRNVHAGDYWLWSQQSCQYRAGLGASGVAVYNAICGGSAPNGLNTPAALVRLNQPSNAANCASGANLTQCGSIYAFGQSGWLATPTAALVYDNVLAAGTRPVNAYTREFASGRVNVCQTPVKATAGGNAARGTIVAPNPNWIP